MRLDLFTHTACERELHVHTPCIIKLLKSQYCEVIVIVAMGSDQKLRSSLSKASAPAASSNTQSITKSSILQSSFAPSYFQLALFASVVRGLDSQQIRIHDTASGRLRCEHAIAPKATINCLDWGYYGDRPWEDHQRDLKKKRKRTEQVNGVANVDNAQDVVLAFGTSDSDVHFYSPAAAKVIGTLKNAHTQGIRDFKFVDAGRGAEGWSIGGDGKLVHWDLRKGKSTRFVSIQRSKFLIHALSVVGLYRCQIHLQGHFVPLDRLYSARPTRFSSSNLSPQTRLHPIQLQTTLCIV